MLDKEKLREMQRLLFNPATGKTTAILATALQYAAKHAESVQVVASSRIRAEQLRESAGWLAQELGIEIERAMERRLYLKHERKNVAIHFQWSGNIVRGMTKTFNDHSFPCSSGVDLEELWSD